MRVPRFVLNWLRAYAATAMRQTRPDEYVGGEANPYMLRWIVYRGRLGRVYLHKFLRDDDDRALHDHPWHSVSVTIFGRPGEWHAHPHVAGDKHFHRYRSFPPGWVAWRPAYVAHRVVLHGEQSATLFITGPKIREWGFFCPRGWRHWREYAKPGKPGEIGKGCAE